MFTETTFPVNRVILRILYAKIYLSLLKELRMISYVNWLIVKLICWQMFTNGVGTSEVGDVAFTRTGGLPGSGLFYIQSESLYSTDVKVLDSTTQNASVIQIKRKLFVGEGGGAARSLTL